MPTKKMTKSQAGRLGGLATTKKLTAKQRSAKARKAALALWEKIRNPMYREAR